jgi:hypothetical protein
MIRLFCRYDKSQVWLNPKEEYGIRPEGRALVGDNGFRPFAETKGHKQKEKIISY